MSMFLATSFPIDTGVDLDFRPASYVADWCATAAAVQNIVGEERREVVHQRLAAGHEQAPLPPRLLADHLRPALRDAVVALDPARHISGEHLPPYEPGEFEIARVVLATMPRLVYSLRVRRCARSEASGRSGYGSPFGAVSDTAYRLVGECGARFSTPAPRTAGVLSLRELVQLIDGVQSFFLDDVPARLPFPERLLWWRSRNEHDARALTTFVRVTSVVYPELGVFYRQRLRWWVVRGVVGAAERVRGAEPLDRALEGWWRRRR